MNNVTMMMVMITFIMMSSEGDDDDVYDFDLVNDVFIINGDNIMFYYVKYPTSTSVPSETVSRGTLLQNVTESLWNTDKVLSQ